jgi:hypothetical protein
MDDNPLSSEELERYLNPRGLPQREKRQGGGKVKKPLDSLQEVETRASEAGLNLEELSLRNLVAFWGKELRAGSFTRISSGSLRVLKDAGVVAHPKPPHYMKGRTLIVTEYGRRLLGIR